MIKKAIVGLMALAIFLALTGVAFAKGDIAPSTYNLNGSKDWHEKIQGTDVRSYDPALVGGLPLSTHIYGTWNSPYTLGVDGFNYNDAQDYTNDGKQIDKNGSGLDDDPTNNIYQSGPHGGYKTTTHRCRECHAVHRAAGKFKLLRSDTRFEACDWCHGTGAGSGFNVQMDNDDNYTKEFNVGHSMGFGLSNGKWKAPDDTYPAFTPNYWLGGFSCFDCHSPHANPQRLLGFNDAGQPVGYFCNVSTDPNISPSAYRYGQVLGIVNPGHGQTSYGDAAATTVECRECHYNSATKANADLYETHVPLPLFPSGSWLLVKDADREVATTEDTNAAYYDVDLSLVNTDVAVGNEISDKIAARSEIINGDATVTSGLLHQFSASEGYPVNKMPVDWNRPIGIALEGETSTGFDHRSLKKQFWSMSEFCTDCHDGNAGLHTIAAPLFSEDRALRNQTQASSGRPTDPGVTGDETNWKGQYDIAYGHDANVRHCARQMQFNPEDNYDFGPHCRNCHKGSSDCGSCHSNTNAMLWTSSIANAANNNYNAGNTTYFAAYWVGDSDPNNIYYGASTFSPKFTSTAFKPGISLGSQPKENIQAFFSVDSYNTGIYKKSRSTPWESNPNSSWRSDPRKTDPGTIITATGGINQACSNDGFSWPHRTMGWKMLKDDLFGLNFDGTAAPIGSTRNFESNGTPGIQAEEMHAVHDLDSVCLDCHNPTVWRATDTKNHVDNPSDPNDNYNDELLLRGLP